MIQNFSSGVNPFKDTDREAKLFDNSLSTICKCMPCHLGPSKILFFVLRPQSIFSNPLLSLTRERESKVKDKGEILFVFFQTNPV